jgi:hypothetical protein
MLAPVLSAGLLAFTAVLAAQGHGAAHLLLILLHLVVALAIGLDGLYHFERAARSNFLLAYALEKEQAFMDQFLHNLLPKDVVALLKKQNPSLARQVVGVGGVGAGVGAKGALGRRASISSPLGMGEGGMASRFAMHFPSTTVFESDIVGYTQMVSSLSPSDTLNMLNLIFSRFDEVAHAVGVEKIETIGDAFMCMTFDGPPNPVLDFALTIVPVLQACNAEHFPRQNLEIRMGICTGSCFGGIVGTEIPRFHLVRYCTAHARTHTRSFVHWCGVWFGIAVCSNCGCDFFCACCLLPCCFVSSSARLTTLRFTSSRTVVRATSSSPRAATRSRRVRTTTSA